MFTFSHIYIYIPMYIQLLCAHSAGLNPKDPVVSDSDGDGLLQPAAGKRAAKAVAGKAKKRARAVRGAAIPGGVAAGDQLATALEEKPIEADVPQEYEEEWTCFCRVTRGGAPF